MLYMYSYNIFILLSLWIPYSG
ncbi:hypothetical protein [Plasmodium yoelii yoelii]|uniref:Uncharacterized protein n=1 Tax=Plasmodium yoelii yoelii TaxID=73239 RepID=Q7RK36_PLAYO|nr:hypothetical protein [Plasmodium yoelii yoelii]